jgi:hypothetical protein
MSNLYVVDSTGTTRAPTKVYVVDAGGVSRYVQKIWAVDSTNTTRLVFNAFTSALYTFTAQGAAVVTIPSGALQVVIEGWGSGAYGGTGYGGSCTGFGGGGGGAGGYFRKTYTLSSANWSKNFNVSSTIAGVGSVTVSSGTFSLSTLTANLGANGSPANISHGGAGGAGGTASGGDVNTTGGAGTAGSGSSTSGTGGTAVTGIHGGPYGKGAQGAAYGGRPLIAPQAGGVVVYFT